MTEIICTSDGNRLTPVNAFYAEELDAVAKGVPLKIKITRPRSLVHNSFYWVCLNAMVKAGAATSKDDIHDACKLKCGLVRMAKMPDGDFFAFPDSTSFGKLDQIGFASYFDKAVEYWKSCKLFDYLPPDLRERLERGER